MQVVEKRKKGVYTLPVKELKGDQLKSLSSGLAQQVLGIISQGERYPKEIAKQLGVHEQKVYYHIRNLEKAGVIKVSREETRQGAVAKYYKLAEPAFIIKFLDLQEASKIPEANESELAPFIENGKLNATIVIGSPYSHGPERSRASDGYYGIDIALFLGTFIHYVPESRVKLDTEMRISDWKENLILLGGPAVNKVVERINQKLPIKFEKKGKWYIYSTLSKKRYNAAESGIVVEIGNPHAKGKKVLVIAGKGYSGTKAATLAFIRKFAEVQKGNKYNRKKKAKVVEGLDLNSDGIVDDVEFRE